MNAGPQFAATIKLARTNAAYFQRMYYVVQYGGNFWIDDKPPKGILFQGAYWEVRPTGECVEKVYRWTANILDEEKICLSCGLRGHATEKCNHESKDF